MAIDGDYLPLREVKRHDCLGLLREAMVTVGPASQTLGAYRLLGYKTGVTFASQRVIADVACLPIGTVKRHTTALIERGYIEWRERQKRRTPDYRIPRRILNEGDVLKFFKMPRWVGRMGMKWAETAVFAAILSRHSLNESLGLDENDDCYGRLAYSLADLQRDCGLSRQSAISGKRGLKERGLIDTDSLSGFADSLLLNLDCRIPSEYLQPRPDACRSTGLNVDHCPMPAKGIQRGKGGLNLSDNQSKSEPRTSPKVSVGWSKSERCSEVTLLNHSSNSISNSTAEPPASAALCDGLRLEESEESRAESADRLIAACSPYAPDATAIAEAIRKGVSRGCSLTQLNQRVAYFAVSKQRWPVATHPDVLYFGLADARPEMGYAQGWVTR